LKDPTYRERGLFRSGTRRDDKERVLKV